MSNCVYEFIGADGKPQKIIGMAAMKAYMAETGMGLDMSSVKVTEPHASTKADSPADFDAIFDAALDDAFGKEESKADLLAELRSRLSNLGMRAMEAGDGAMAGRISGFTVGMHDTDANLTRAWVDEVIAEREKAVAKLERKKAATSPKALKPANKAKANLLDAAKQAGMLEVVHVGDKKASKAEVTSETARKAQFNLTSGAEAKVTEHAEHGKFTVMVAGESYGTFLMSDAGKVSGIKARANWAKDSVLEAANTFAAMQRGETTNVADAEQVTPASKSAISAAKNVGMGLSEVAKGLTALFSPKAGQFNSGLVFDEQTYEAAKPYFRAGIAHFKDAAADIQATVFSLVKTMRDQFGMDRATIFRMKPYLERFVKDVQNGVIDGEGNEPQVQSTGAQALDGMAPQEGGNTEGGGDAGLSPEHSGNPGDSPGDGVDGAGVSTARGRGSRASGVRSTEARGKSKRSGSDRAGKAGSGVPGTAPQGTGDSGRSGRTGPAGHDSQAVEPPNVPATNYRITEDTRLGKGGEVEKFNDNIAAIKTLKQIEADRRRATPEEQRILARYVGWGGLANAFTDPITGEFKDKWRERGEMLRDLLTKQELDKARNSTTAAFYTPETVIHAMWDAAQRLGFKGGLTLEDSMGVGNFLGLAPEGIDAKFIGVEYDGLTARIAQALYPQATVLHAGFEKTPVVDNAFALNIGNPPYHGSESLHFQFKPELSGVSIHNQFFRAGMDALRPGGLQIKVVSRFLMDAEDKSTRLALSSKAKLLGLIRLPDTAFKENARTEVVTDIVILQKMTEQEQAEMVHAVDAYRQQPSKDPGAERERKALAEKVPAWVETVEVADPTGGEPIRVNRHFAENPHDILGVLERSGSKFNGNDVTVRLDDITRLGEMLSDAVARLPEGVQNFDAEVLANTESRFKSMSDALRIAIAKEEIGHLKLDEDGKLHRVIERETPEGGVELSRQEITPSAPWSDQLNQDANGNWYRLAAQVDESGAKVKAVDKNGKATKRNVYDREVFKSEADVPDSLRLGATGYARLLGMVGLRDLLKAQLVMETEDAAPKVMEANRKKLAKAYEAFVAEHGPVSRPVNLNLAMTMPDGGLVAALEVSYQPARSAAQANKSGLPTQDEVATPAPVMRERVVPKYEPATSASSPADALAIVLSETGRVNMERIAALRGISQDEAVAELQDGDSPLVFKDPETGLWETADNYLSGMVKRKLKAAQEAGMAKNIAALEAVQPEPWTAENVTVTFGAGWVPADVYASFVEHLVGGSAKVSYSQLTNSFTMSTKGADRNRLESWGSEGASFDYILSRALNSQSVTVTYRDADDNMRVDREKTDLANIKAKEIRNEFSEWIFADTERRERLVTINNELFNVRVTRQHNGQHLALPGKVPDSIIKMRRHQLNAIWRGIYERFMLVDHAVGAGKTFTAIARAMERRRMGLSKKPMIVVPNHLVEQWEADVYRLYPGAKVLAAGKKDFEVKNRRRLLGKIATGDWDIVIMPHSSFGGIGIAPETERRYLEHELALAMEAVKDAEDQAAEDGTDTGWRKPFGVKQAEALVKQIEGRMEKISSTVRDRLLTFEQLGVDDLTVDESHEFKNLYYSSRLTGVRGMGDRGGSRKANDLYNKVRVLRDSPTGSVTFMTGTPISNSAVEMYTVMRYLAADSLNELGLENFDAWRTQFVEHTTAFEPTEAGGLKEVSRLGRTWSNMRSLMELYYQFTDAVSLEDIQRWYSEDNSGKEFPVPKLKGGDRQLVKVKPTKAQESFLKEIIQGFDHLPDIEDVYERNAERLRLMDRARKVSLDVRAIAPSNPSDEKGGKLDVAAQNIKRIYDKWDSVNGTQLVFLDRSVPKAKGDDKILKEYDDLRAKRESALTSGDTEAYDDISEKLEKYDANEMEALRNAQNGGWNAYQQLKDSLVASGIPANEIRFVQEANTDEQKMALFDAVRGGKVRVLLGSTPRMGAGTNVQDRLVALHHIDVTWKPSDIEQREGRIIRQGNIFATPPDGNKPNPHFRPDFEVEILAYATERTVDAKMWDLNATKLRTINGIRKYDGAFTMDFEDADSVSMAEMAAAASGNPMLLERVQLESEINLLELQERAHRRKMYGAVDAVRRAKEYIEKNPQRIENEKAKIEAARERAMGLEKAVDARTVTVEGKTYTDRFEAAKAATDLIQEQKAGDEKAKFAVNINGKRYTSKDATFDAVDAAFGDATPFEMTIDGRTTGQRTVAGRDVASMLNIASSEMTGDAHKEVELGTALGLRLVAGLDRRVFEGEATIDGDIALIDAEGRTVVSEYLDRKQAQIAYNTTGVKNVLDRAFARVLAQTSDFTLHTLESQLKRAKEEIHTLEAKADEKFADSDKLEQKRKRLLDVVSLLERGPEVATHEEERWNPGQPKYMAPAMYSQAVEGDKVSGVPLDVAEKSAQKVLEGLGLAGLVQIEVVSSPASIGLTPPAGVVPTGATMNGKVYVFSDNLADELDAFQVVFHELFHLGLSQSVQQEQYSQTMLKFMRDPLVFQYAKRWKASADGQESMKAMPTNNWHAKAVEEAFADIAEGLSINGGLIGTKEINAWVKRSIITLANLADKFGLAGVAKKLRGLTHTDAERYVIDTLLKSRSGAPVYLKDERFSSSRQGVDNAIKSSVVTSIKSLANYKATDLMSIGLQTLGRRQLVDIYGGMLPLDHYSHLTAQMEADKNDGGAEADELVTRWAKLPDERQLAELMHDATLAQIDPAKAVPYTATEAERATHAELRERFNALSEEARKVYKQARDDYQRHHFNVRGAIAERVARSELSNERKAALLKKMDMQFFKAVKGVYFPLARFGQYVVAVKAPDGKISSVSRAETMAEAQQLRKTLMANFPADAGYDVGQVTRDRDFTATRDAVGRGFMTELYEAIDKQDLTDDQRAEIEDTLGQLYLSSLPDLSWAKHGIHRKGMPGFSQDARRAFAQNMFHGSRYLAKLKYSDQMQHELNRMQQAVDAMAKRGDTNQPRAQQVVDEMVKRHESMMNPKSHPLSTALTSFGFIFHLGLSPASALVNVSQTAFVAYPVMGAKWGFDKAAAALLKASGQAAVGKNDITGALTADERAAYDAAVRAGTIDVTMAHDLAGVAQGEDSGVMWRIRPVMRAASYLFHHAERFNRQVTFIAAYRLAREAGASHIEAQEQATQATYDGHFDYSAANRPRFMQGTVAKVVLLFKQYAQNMIYTMLRNAYVGFIKEAPGANEKAKAKEARRVIYGLAAMTQVAAGAMGMPWLLTAIPLAIAQAIGGDDDEPWDAEVALQNYLADAFGHKFAEVFMHGFSRLTPFDISGRVGLDKMIFPDVQEGLSAGSWVESFGFGMAGAVPGIALNWGKGLQDIAQGHTMLGIETMMPVVLRNAMKSVRYAMEGAQDKTGITIMDDVGPVSVFGQALGFSPSEVRHATEGKSAIREADKKLSERRQSLMNKFARASMHGDTETMQEARKEISRFNGKNPERRITNENLMSSVRMRNRRVNEAQHGVYLSKTHRGVMNEGRFAFEGDSEE